MSQHNLPKLQSCHVDDLKIPDFDERKTVQVAALLGKEIRQQYRHGQVDQDDLLDRPKVSGRSGLSHNF